MSEAYKANQGIFVRRIAFWSLLFLLVWGLGIEFYDQLSRFESLNEPFFGQKRFAEAWQVPALGQVVNPAFVIAWVTTIIASVLLHRLLNRPKTAEFLIGADDELGKVSWPSRRDAWSSSVIVMVFVVFLAGFLMGVDNLLSRLFGLILEKGAS